MLVRPPGLCEALCGSLLSAVGVMRAPLCGRGIIGVFSTDSRTFPHADTSTAAQTRAPLPCLALRRAMLELVGAWELRCLRCDGQAVAHAHLPVVLRLHLPVTHLADPVAFHLPTFSHTLKRLKDSRLSSCACCAPALCAAAISSCTCALGGQWSYLLRGRGHML